MQATIAGMAGVDIETYEARNTELANSIRIFGAAHRYYQGPGALNLLGDICDQIAGNPVIVIDGDVFSLLGERLKAVFGERRYSALPFRGEVTVLAMEALAVDARALGAGVIVGVGGGKALDAGKGVAIRCGLGFISVPTIASNDSPTSMGLAVYDDTHRVAAIETHPRSPEAVVVDTTIIATAPSHFLRAGMGDAIAKKFEAEASVRDGGLSAHFSRQLRTSLYIADGCYQTIRSHGAKAIQVAGGGLATPAFDAVVEANILMAGLGFENAGLSLAHAMTRGLVRTPGVDHCLHGYHVAYGLLIQLTIEERGDAFVDDIAAFYTQVGLPRSLKDLGLPRVENDAVESMAKNVTAAPKGAYLVVPVGPERLREAIYHVEARYSGPAILEQQIG
jgi:glycerol dehydrogenase